MLALDLADCDDWVEARLEAELEDLEEFAARVIPELELLAEEALFALLDVSVFAVEAFDVELLADAPLEASAVWLAPPETAVLFAPLFDLLLKFELSVAFAVPAVPAIAVSEVPELLVASVPVAACVAAEELFADLEELAAAFKAALAVEELDEPFVREALLDEVALSDLEELWLADLLAFMLLLFDELKVALSVFEDELLMFELLEAL